MDLGRPVARRDDLLVEEVDGELLVYDEERDVALRLNATAALVWRSCDGTTTCDELLAILTEELGQVADEDMLLMALDGLVEHGLIISGYDARAADAVRLSRRRFFRRAGVVGAAAMAVPVVSSMIVPTAAAAQSVAYPYYATSDRRLKRNIRTLGGRR